MHSERQSLSEGISPKALPLFSLTPEAPRHIGTRIGVGWIGGQSMGFNTPEIDNLRISSRITSDWVLSVTSQNLARCSYSLSDTRVVTCFMVVNLLLNCYHTIVQVNQLQLTAACALNLDNLEYGVPSRNRLLVVASVGG